MIRNALGWPHQLVAPWWLFTILATRWLRLERFEARLMGYALARSIALAREGRRG